MHLLLGILLFIVAILSVISTVKQMKAKNLFGLAFSAVSVLAFGFFSVMTIIQEITG
ncbi:DUF2759 domain-containing protein [Virgibacillus phasianinus]|uniref:DUF2759 domain-containing protein n=1 Tax=Virgibacillus phasianinus TaxID=2017483 RepID=A0A220U520_9BACI|nr:DUF2759 family protein [Virgibacillus phasianinus]ASK63199.1 DUF2759 domain-containing protein [Virgibacillus phasianinus]